MMLLSLLPTAVLADESATKTYTKVTSADELVTGEYVMVANNGYAPGVLDDSWVTAVAVTAANDQVIDPTGGVWTLTVGKNGTILSDANGKAIAPKGGNNNGMHHPEETAKTLQHHADGLTWVCTGDLGTMDSEGFVYFRGRAKRMIVTSGYNVYPAQIENILDAHEFVQMSCVIGVPDSYKMQKVKAFVKLVPGVEKNDETKRSIMEYCRKYVAKYAMPYDIEFRDELPKTLVGKVAYRVLEEEELGKLQEPAPVE